MIFRAGLLAGLLWIGSIGVLMAQGTDTTYVRIYHMIQQADALRDHNQAAQAVRQYEEARKSLLEFQDAHPEWYPNIVKYRLNYVSSRLEKLREDLNITEPAASPTPADLASLPPERQLEALQGQIQELNAQNALLQEKLKEAWSVQPVSNDPSELAAAKERIVELEKERDLLKVAMEQRASTPASVDAAMLLQEQAVLAAVREELARERDQGAALRAENELLKSEMADLRQARTVTPIPNSDLSQQLQAATAALEELRATNKVMRTQLVFLDAQMSELTASVGSGNGQQRLDTLELELKSAKAELKASEKDRASLTKQLAAANRRLERRKESEQVDELERQLREVQARLAALDAEKVPLTPEEAALVDQGAAVDMALDRHPAAAATPKALQLPPGTGPLITEAEAAMQQGRFEEAEQKLLDVLRQDENNVFTLTQLGRVQMELKRTEEAERSLAKAMSLDPSDPASLFMMGVLKYQMQDYDTAIDLLSRSAQIYSERPETQYFLGMALLKNGNRAPAERALRKAIQLRPGWSAAHYELAVVYASQNPPFRELAEWHYQKAVSGGTPRNLDLERLIEGDSAKESPAKDSPAKDTPGKDTPGKDTPGKGP